MKQKKKYKTLSIMQKPFYPKLKKERKGNGVSGGGSRLCEAHAKRCKKKMKRRGVDLRLESIALQATPAEKKKESEEKDLFYLGDLGYK